jgi:thiamine-monophosphate kinase
MTTISELGEFGLIAHLTANLPMMQGVITGVGDDAAILEMENSQVLLATCDSQVENVHFRLATSTPYDIGWKALAVNLSDIAAMGGTPRFALISLMLPSFFDMAMIDSIYAGLREAAETYETAIVGGNISVHPEHLIIDITLLGTGSPDHILRRSGAHSDDIIMVTGHLGAAAAEILLQEDTATISKDSHINIHYRPIPQVKAGQWLAQHGATAAIDISDGLSADLHHLCNASNVGAQITAELLPIEATTRAIAALYGKEAEDLALFGGEDYQLLFTIPSKLAPMIVQELPIATGISATIIGTVQSSTGLRLSRHGNVLPLQPGGWDHMIHQ